MSFQGGLFYFDRRPIPDCETGTIVGWVLSNDCAPPTTLNGPGIFLAHAQLAHGRTCAVTFDGRLDNRADLQRSLGDPTASDASDATLAVTAYETWGSPGFGHLIGDWSLALWDPQKETVVLASDFAGVRPLYYAVERTRVVWSTRLRPLVDWLRAREIDDTYVAGLLAFGGCPNRTPYRGIYSVPPGHTVEVSAAQTHIRRFWKLPLDQPIRYAHESEYEEHLRSLFREAVGCRLPAAGTCLCELSGGFDSSSVVTMATDLIRTGEVPSKPAVALSFEHQGSLDEKYYTAVARACGLESVRLSTRDHPFLNETALDGILPAFWGSLHTEIAAIARNLGATTYMTGQLGDTVMGNWWDDSAQVAGLMRDGRIPAGLHQALTWAKLLRVPVTRILWNALLANLPPSRLAARWLPQLGWRDPVPDTGDSLAPAFRKCTQQARACFSDDWVHARPERRGHFRALMQTLELRRLQPPEPLEHLSYVHPFAHRPLVEFMLSIPAGIACRPGEPRRLMRRALGQYWPPELRHRRSKDALGGVFLESLRPLAHAFLQPGQPLRVVECGYVDRASLNQRLDRLSMSLGCNETQLRQIILLELWLRQREGRLKL